MQFSRIYLCITDKKIYVKKLPTEIRYDSCHKYFHVLTIKRMKTKNYQSVSGFTTRDYKTKHFPDENKINKSFPTIES